MQVLLCFIVHTGHAAPRRRGGPRPCSFCGQLGHNARSCPLAREQQQQEQEDRTARRGGLPCTLCGETGHYASTCPRAQEQQQEQQQQQASQRGGARPCTICGETGHYADTCPHARDQACTICGELGHNARSCPAREAPQEQPQRQQRQYLCGVCGQPGHNARTCDRHAAAATAATEAAAAAGGSQFEQEDEQGGQHTVMPERVNLHAARRGGALSPATLPHLFAERPECVCDSCHRTFLCSSRSGSSPREVRNSCA